MTPEMPADTGMGFVVITHQHPGHTSLLPLLLDKITGIKVLVAADGMRVEPNRVYVSPPGGSLAMLGGTLHRMETEKKDAPHLPIERSGTQGQTARLVRYLWVKLLFRD